MALSTLGLEDVHFDPETYKLNNKILLPRHPVYNDGTRAGQGRRGNTQKSLDH